ncbi:MAG: hypothetical protein RI591_00890 [Dehalococcoidia bacterium]|nr:hypothetical protein [Dehalococcoidia bacterium]
MVNGRTLDFWQLEDNILSQDEVNVYFYLQKRSDTSRKRRYEAPRLVTLIRGQATFQAGSISSSVAAIKFRVL